MAIWWMERDGGWGGWRGVAIVCLQVMVLDSMTVDCSEYIVSWSVGGNKESLQPSRISSNLHTAPSGTYTSLLRYNWLCVARSLTEASSQHSIALLQSLSAGCEHSVMAAHSDDSAECTDDLQALFELAEKLHGQTPSEGAPEVKFSELGRVYILMWGKYLPVSMGIGQWFVFIALNCHLWMECTIYVEHLSDA